MGLSLTLRPRLADVKASIAGHHLEQIPEQISCQAIALDRNRIFEIHLSDGHHAAVSSL